MNNNLKYVEYYLTEVARNGNSGVVSISSAKSYLRFLKRYLAFCEENGVIPEHASAETITQWLDKAGWKLASRNAAVSALRWSANYAGINIPQLALVTSKRAEKASPADLPDEATLDRVMNLNPAAFGKFGERSLAMLGFIIDTLADEHEIRAMRIGDVQWQNSSATIPETGGGERCVTLSSRTLSALLAYLNWRDQNYGHSNPDERLFLTEKGPISDTTIWRTIEKAMEIVNFQPGIVRAGMDMFRAACARALFVRGERPETLARNMHFPDKEKLFSLIGMGGWGKYSPVFDKMTAEKLVAQATARRAENPNYLPTVAELAAINQIQVEQTRERLASRL